MSHPEPVNSQVERLFPGLHCLILLPFAGLLFVLFARVRTKSAPARRELTEILLVQGLAAAVVGVHVVLQLGIEGARWLWLRTLDMGLGVEDSLVPQMLLVGTVLNVGAGLLEWGVLVFTGLRAARGVPYPGRSGAAGVRESDSGG